MTYDTQGHFYYRDPVKVKVGEVTVGNYCDIGAQGFGILRDHNGIPHQIEHEGGVHFKGKASIGSNSVIERATKKGDNTIIGENVFIDNLVLIGHNVEIGDGTIICGGSVVGGTVKIGKNCFIGIGANIRQRITIGDQVIVGAGAYVSKSVPDRDIVGGVPAVSIKDKVYISDYDRFRMVGY